MDNQTIQRSPEDAFKRRISKIEKNKRAYYLSDSFNKDLVIAGHAIIRDILAFGLEKGAKINDKIKAFEALVKYRDMINSDVQFAITKMKSLNAVQMAGMRKELSKNAIDIRKFEVNDLFNLPAVKKERERVNKQASSNKKLAIYREARYGRIKRKSKPKPTNSGGSGGAGSGSGSGSGPASTNHASARKGRAGQIQS